MPVAGDLSKPGLGIEGFDEPIDHLFHLAAVYDIEADEEASERANVEGTQHVIEFANAHEVGRFHHTSSIAVAGNYEGVFQEDMFDEGQKLPHHYHRTKYESERLVRERAWRRRRWCSGRASWSATRRPARWTRSTVPTTSSSCSRSSATRCRSGSRSPARRAARPTSCRWTSWRAPMDHIAHLPEDELPGDTFHLVNPEPMTVGETLNEFAKAARAPVRDARRPEHDERRAEAGARGADSAADRQADPRPALPRPRRPAGRDGAPRLPRKFDARDAQRALSGTGIAVPPLSTYAPRLWDYWERNLDPDLFRDRSLASVIKGKRVLITGASSGIGLETALKVGEAGGEVLLVSRTREKLEEVAKQVEEAGGTRVHRPTSPTSRTSTAWRPRCSSSTAAWTCSSTTPAARSAARSSAPTTASTTSSARCS